MREGDGMRAYRKLLIGLFAALLCGWIAHGPLGQGESFIAGMEEKAHRVIRASELAVEVEFPRSPLRRVARLSGEADDFQREGQGRFPGLNDRLETIAGLGGLHWADESRAKGGALPLLVETWILVGIAFLIGLGLGWLIFRPRREGFL